MTTKDDNPGRTMTDSERSPFGLGWEYARRKWNRERCPLKGTEAWFKFACGYDQYVCSHRDVDKAMLTQGVPMEGKP